MGVNSSKQLSGSNSIDLGLVLVSFAETPIPLRNAEPRVVLANKSDYIVSYWVVEEDKRSAKAKQERVASSIGLHLNASKISENNLSGYLKKLKEEQEATLAKAEREEDEDVAHFLTRDHRMGRNGSTQPTQVSFPAGCQHVRVYGFFEKDGEWQPYQDKVYSIALRNKNFNVTATTSNITAPHSKRRAIRAAKRREK